MSNQFSNGDNKGVYYMIENGNLQKKQQSYAADKLQRFNYANVSQVGADIGPGSYDINQ